MKRILWLSDLHLDVVTKDYRQKFYNRLSKAEGEVVVITGDISNAGNLSTHLPELAEACNPHPIYFVLGNHDYYGSSFDLVHSNVESVCKRHKNLRNLGHGEIIPLGDDAALVGHGGWADGRAGHGLGSSRRNPDFGSIEDFKRIGRDDCYRKMNALGQESARYFRKVLPYALTCYRHLWVATHVPSFTQAAWWNGKPCNYDFQPHYTNMSAGYALWALSDAFPKSTMTVLSGHTHSEISLSLKENLHVYTAGANPGYPRYEGILGGVASPR